MNLSLLIVPAFRDSANFPANPHKLDIYQFLLPSSFERVAKLNSSPCRLNSVRKLLVFQLKPKPPAVWFMAIVMAITPQSSFTVSKCSYIDH